METIIIMSVLILMVFALIGIFGMFGGILFGKEYWEWKIWKGKLSILAIICVIVAFILFMITFLNMGVIINLTNVSVGFVCATIILFAVVGMIFTAEWLKKLLFKNKLKKSEWGERGEGEEEEE